MSFVKTVAATAIGITIPVIALGALSLNERFMKWYTKATLHASMSVFNEKK